MISIKNWIAYTFLIGIPAGIAITGPDRELHVISYTAAGHWAGVFVVWVFFSLHKLPRSVDWRLWRNRSSMSAEQSAVVRRFGYRLAFCFSTAVFVIVWAVCISWSKGWL